MPMSPSKSAPDTERKTTQIFSKLITNFITTAEKIFAKENPKTKKATTRERDEQNIGGNISGRREERVKIDLQLRSHRRINHLKAFFRSHKAWSVWRSIITEDQQWPAIYCNQKINHAWRNSSTRIESSKESEGNRSIEASFQRTAPSVHQLEENRRTKDKRKSEKKKEKKRREEGIEFWAQSEAKKGSWQSKAEECRCAIHRRCRAEKGKKDGGQTPLLRCVAKA